MKTRSSRRARSAWPRRLPTWLLLVLTVALALIAYPAQAHEMSMAEMEVRETAPGEFLWLWSATNDKRPMGDDLTPHWPDGCTGEAYAVRCGGGGLKGTFSVDGVGKRYSAALVR